MRKYLIYFILIFSVTSFFGQSANENYILEKEYLVEGAGNNDNIPSYITLNSTTNTSEYTASQGIVLKPGFHNTYGASVVLKINPIGTEAIKNISYFDGLGRKIQEIGIGQSPNHKDIIYHYEYDAFGRQSQDYLPYEEVTGVLGSFRSNDQKLAIKNYYKTNYPDDFSGISNVNLVNPNTDREYDSSPLNRILKQATPGKDWKLGSGHEVKFDYKTNQNNEVRLYKVTLSSDKTPSLHNPAPYYYPVGVLTKNIIKDENWKPSDGVNNTTEKFSDKQGRTLVSRAYFNGQKLDTYYIYDDRGNLTYVLPPKTESRVAAPTAVELNELCYQYKYDKWNRLVEKKLPGKQKIYTIYDVHDRPILTQDGVLRSNNLWFFTKFDTFGRVIYSGLYTSNFSRKNLQIQVDNYTSSNNPNNSEDRISSTISIGGIGLNYQNTAFPITGISQILEVNYYDDYNFTDTDKPSLPFSILSQTVTTRTNGLLTASWVKTLDKNTWTKTYLYYDEKGRGIRSYVKNHLGGNTIVDSEVDFRGKVKKIVTTQKRVASDNPLVITDNFQYDHSELLIKQTQKINNQPIENIVSNEFDGLGVLIRKNVGGTLPTPLQKIDYKYNIKGQLTQINDVNNTLSTSPDNDLFAYKINYNNTIEGTASVPKLYNGNISQAIWRTANIDVKQSYAFNHDYLNRITSAQYRKGNLLNSYSNYFTLSNLSYDKAGNIKTLQRRGVGNLIDNLSYSYKNISGIETNQLEKVTDASHNSQGFNDGNISGNDYTYDVNGRLIADKNKGITQITYNILDLPKKITFLNGNRIEVVYDAVGNKLEKLYFSSSGVTKTLYTNGFQYQNNQLQFFGHSQGYTYKDGTHYKYAYIFTDQLGNNRLSYSDVNQNGTISSTEIFSQTNYYPFGLIHSGELVTSLGSNYNYKYQGKEFLLENGIRQYDFGSRMYNPALGRWSILDPQAESQYGVSPYMAMGNNPIFFVDPNGELVGIDDLILGVVGGIGNVVSQAISGNIDGWGSGLAYFGIGFAAGATATWTGGIGSAAILSAGNSAYTQYHQTGSVDLGQLALDTSIGTFTAFAGNQLSSFIKPYASKLFQGITGNAIKQYATNAFTYALSGFTISTGLSFAQNGDFNAAVSDGISSIPQSLVASGINTGAAKIIANRHNSTPSKGNKTAQTAEQKTDNAIAKAKEVAAKGGASNIVSKNIRFQKQTLEHVIGGERLGTNSYLNSVDDAKSVLNATHNGDAKILSTNASQNRVYVQYDGVKGYYNNNGTIIETNKFLIKGVKSATVVPIHPNSITFK